MFWCVRDERASSPFPCWTLDVSTVGVCNDTFIHHHETLLCAAENERTYTRWGAAEMPLTLPPCLRDAALLLLHEKSQELFFRVRMRHAPPSILPPLRGAFNFSQRKCAYTGGTGISPRCPALLPFSMLRAESLQQRCKEVKVLGDKVRLRDDHGVGIEDLSVGAAEQSANVASPEGDADDAKVRRDVHGLANQTWGGGSLALGSSELGARLGQGCRQVQSQPEVELLQVVHAKSLPGTRLHSKVDNRVVRLEDSQVRGRVHGPDDSALPLGASGPLLRVAARGVVGLDFGQGAQPAQGRAAVRQIGQLLPPVRELVGHVRTAEELGKDVGQRRRLGYSSAAGPRGGLGELGRDENCPAEGWALEELDRKSVV